MAAARDIVINNRDVMKNVCDLLSFRERLASYQVSTFFKDLNREYVEQEVKDLSTKPGAELRALGIASEETAMLILKTPELLNILGGYNSRIAYDSTIDRNSPDQNGTLLLSLGMAHNSAAQHILAHEHIKTKLRQDQILQLEDKVNPTPAVVVRFACMD